jgi:hypothetical protein
MDSKRGVRGELRTVGAAELAGMMQVCTQRIYQLAAAGMLPHFRVSGALRFDPELIEEWRKRNNIEMLHPTSGDFDEPGNEP